MMTDILGRASGRRAVLAGLALGGGALALGGCVGMPGFGLEDAVQRLLYQSSERAFARMLQADGFWDDQVARLGLENLLGTRGGAMSRILTSGLFKERMYDAFGAIAYRGAERAAPLVTDAVRVMGVQNTIDLVRGEPGTATAALRRQMGGRLVEAMVPELGDAMRVADDPLVAETLSALVGADIRQVAGRMAGQIEDVIWREITNEEIAIWRNPESTGDPVLEQVFGGSR